MSEIVKRFSKEPRRQKEIMQEHNPWWKWVLSNALFHQAQRAASRKKQVTLTHQEGFDDLKGKDILSSDENKSGSG